MYVLMNINVLNAQRDMSFKEIDVKKLEMESGEQHIRAYVMRDSMRMKTENVFLADSPTVLNIPQQTASAVTMNSSYMMI